MCWSKFTFKQTLSDQTNQVLKQFSEKTFNHSIFNKFVFHFDVLDFIALFQNSFGGKRQNLNTLISRSLFHIYIYLPMEIGCKESLI